MPLQHSRKPSYISLGGFWQLHRLEQHILQPLLSVKASFSVMVGEEKRRRADAADPDIPTVHQSWFYSGTKRTYASTNLFFYSAVQSKQKKEAFYWRHFSVVKVVWSREIKQFCDFSRICSLPEIRLTALQAHSRASRQVRDMRTSASEAIGDHLRALCTC
jgi:hypothetical protein